jgi:dTDP-4-dehydrorhamnose 3,5-epimerase-like enzyme
MNGPTLADIKIDTLPTMRDARGALTVAEFREFVPFPVARLFYVRDVPAGTMRGQHAHYRCQQYLICQNGRVRLTLADGISEERFELSPGQGVLIAPGIFAAETYLETASILLVLCDRSYEKEDYIHTMDEFLSYRAKQ